MTKKDRLRIDGLQGLTFMMLMLDVIEPEAKDSAMRGLYSKIFQRENEENMKRKRKSKQQKRKVLGS